MPTKPNISRMSASTPDILNAVRNTASTQYKSLVPRATDTNVRQVGQVILGNPTFQNEFLSGLVNRIGKVMISSKLYANPWSFFKKGLMEYGETIEEIFVNIAKAHTYDIERSESEVFKREIPDVIGAFHILNYQTFYKATVQEEQLRQAFVSMDGVTDLIARIVDSMYTGANFDEFLVMKYMIARHILDGTFYPVTIPTPTPENMHQIASAFKKASNDLEFMSDEYNTAGVSTYSMKEDQYLILNSDLDASMDVNVLATSFNMTKAEFMGHRVLVDSFGKLDTKRLNDLFKDDPNYIEISQDDLKELSKIPAVLIDRDWFQIYDNMNKFTENYNGQGLYWNYWYHQWKTFSVSPFNSALAFIAGTPTVTSVQVTPQTASVKAGGQVLLDVNVMTQNFAPKAVAWACDDEFANVNYAGVVSIRKNAPSGSTITVTATSIYDISKSSTCTITVL